MKEYHKDLLKYALFIIIFLACAMIVFYYFFEYVTRLDQLCPVDWVCSPPEKPISIPFWD